MLLPLASHQNDFFMRPLSSPDATSLVHMVQQNRGELLPWFQWVQHFDEHHSQRYILSCQLAAQRQQSWSYILVQRRTMLPMGVVALEDFNPEAKTASLGIWLDRAHQGKGHAYRACQALLTAFDGVLKQCFWQCDPSNQASLRLARRLGFTARPSVSEPTNAWCGIKNLFL